MRWAINVRGADDALTATEDGETVEDLQFVFAASPNNDGRITQMVDGPAGETVNYQYDSLGRLTLAEIVGDPWLQNCNKTIRPGM